MEINPINISKTDIRISENNIIPRIEHPIVHETQPPIVRRIAVPIFDLPDYSIKYPIIDVPTKEEFDAAVKAERESQQLPQLDKSRALPDSPPQLSPEIQEAVQQTTPTTPQVEVPTQPKTPTFKVNGIYINLPDPSLVATAGSVAVVTTAATMVATTVFNALKNAAEPIIKEATKNKLKIKIKQVKPVLHYVLTEDGTIDIFEYSSEGTRLIDSTDNVEQYIRDQVEINSLYEIDNKVIIDDVIANKFTREGKERFKPLFAPARKVARKLSARLSF